MEAYSYIDQPRSGLMNMAIDEAMLEFADQHQVVVLRLYEWSEPTLSLGYFQKVGEREEHEASRSISLVRRATGGGAIVHHHDLTYALAIPQASSTVGAAPATYAAVHAAMVEWLNEMGVAARQWEETYKLPTPGAPSAGLSKTEFLCFHRRSSGDVVVGEHKVLGSAQRRGKAALLQHGSLLLATSQYAPSLVGLERMLPAGERLKSGKGAAEFRLFATEMLLRLERGIDALLGVELKCAGDVTDSLLTAAAVKAAKFESPSWLLRV